MALRHIRLTRRAAETIAASIKFFLKRKKYLMLKTLVKPQSRPSRFMEMLHANSPKTSAELHEGMDNFYSSTPEKDRVKELKVLRLAKYVAKQNMMDALE